MAGEASVITVPYLWRVTPNRLLAPTGQGLGALPILRQSAACPVLSGPYLAPSDTKLVGARCPRGEPRPVGLRASMPQSPPAHVHGGLLLSRTSRRPQRVVLRLARQHECDLHLAILHPEADPAGVQRCRKLETRLVPDSCAEAGAVTREATVSDSAVASRKAERGERVNIIGLRV